MVTASTNKIIRAIIGSVFVMYLFAYTFGDAVTELATLNDSVTGGAIAKTLIPIFVVLGVGYALYKSMFGQK